MVKAKEAVKIILSSIKPIGSEEVYLSNCLDRILACDIRAKFSLPSFDNSAMDGYAVKAKDTAGASKAHPKILRVVEDIPAGYVAERKLKKGEAIRIMTGAPLPEDADSVVMVEFTEKVICDKKKRQELIGVFKEVKIGENIRKTGEDVKKGQKILSRGSVLRAQELGMIAALGVSKVRVGKKARIGILATGDELITVEKKLVKGKIYNSNSFMINGQIIKCGAIPVDLGIVRDKSSMVKSRIQAGFKKNLDMLLVLGGISVGDYDLVKEVLLELGMEMKIWKVAMRPGKPLAFGIISGIPVFGLPGNPVSSAITFEEFVRPAILKMQGAKNLFRPGIWAILEQDFSKKKGLKYFIRAKIKQKNGKYHASITGPQGSAIISSLVLADGIIVAPEEADVLKKGTSVYVQLLRHGYDGGAI